MISNYVNDYEYATRKVNRVRACPWLLDRLGRWGFCCNPSGFGNFVDDLKERKMKSVKDKKEEMGFVSKAPMCCNCSHFIKKETGEVKGWDGKWRPMRITNTCEIGKFSVKPQSYCLHYNRS